MTTVVSSPTGAVPEQGQLVRVRHARYLVSDVLKSAVNFSTSSSQFATPQHLVFLTSVEDDAQGEELQVIWELEPGAQVLERMALPAPTGFDEPHRLDTFLNAVRWGAVSSADVRALQAPFRSGIDTEDYQLDPVVRAIQMPRANLLIADDVGLGKTIEAGLVVQELIVRHRARRILVVCPSALQIQWRDQLRDKFGLEFRIVDSKLMKELRRQRGIHVNPWTHFPRLITSIDFLKREQPSRLFREILPDEGALPYPRRFDLLIVDEAHNIAPPGQAHYAIDSQRTAVIRMLVPHFEHRLFLTATPHNGYPASFSALLELLDNQRFARGVRPDPERLAQIMVRRLKSEITNWDGTPRFPARQIQDIRVAYTEQERQAHQWLREYTKLSLAAASEKAQHTALEFVLKLLKKRLLSSPAAFAATLAQHERSLREQSATHAQHSFLRHSEGVLRAMVEGFDEEYDDDEAYDEATSAMVRTLTEMFRPPSAETSALLGKMREWAATASNRPDSKARQLIEWLKQTIRTGGQWSDERVIIFTEYRATQNWLHQLLAGEGLTHGERLLTMYGGMPLDDRERIKAAFQAKPQDSPVRILLATDAASEGIDLQLHCHRLIHYEIPWNPNRMEQRNGRIDRHGQRHAPLIFHFVPEGYETGAHRDKPYGELEGDLEFLRRAVDKVEHIREDLGKVGPVIAARVEEAMLGRDRNLDTQAEERKRPSLRSLYRFERNLKERIDRLHDQLEESKHSLRLSPENIQEAVQVALELAGQPPLEPTTLEGAWPDPTRRRRIPPVFRVPALRGSWAVCTEGLEHPHTHAIRPIVFDHDLARGRDDVVLAHMNHRLVQMALRLLRAEIWSFEGAKKLHRVTARVVPDHVLSDPVVVAHARLVVTGGDGHRLHEELITAGGEIRDGQFRRIEQVGRVQELAGIMSDVQPSEAFKQRLARLWPGLEPVLKLALDRRMKERTASMARQLAERADKEADDITTILRELEQAIRDELDGPEYVQLALFTTPEREQYERDVVALRTRLAQIPVEIEKETEHLRRRYADPQPRLFPVAVTFLVPARLERR